MLDLNQQRLDFCKKRMGVNHTVLSRGDGSEIDALKELTNGTLPTVVIDATGSNKSMGNALNYLGFTGRLVYVGLSTLEISFPQPLMHRREMTIFASRNSLPKDFGDASTAPCCIVVTAHEGGARPFVGKRS